MTSSNTAFARMWLRSSMPPAWKAAAPPLVLMALLLNTILGPMGMHPSEFAPLLLQVPRICAALLLLWCLAMVPATRLALAAPGLSYLRASPGAGLVLTTGCGGFVASSLHGPWIVIFALGGLPILGVVLSAVLATLCLFLATPGHALKRFKANSIAIASLALGTLGLFRCLTELHLLAPVLFLLVLSAHEASKRAMEAGPTATRMPILAMPWAPFSAEVVILCRQHRDSLLRSAMLASLVLWISLKIVAHGNTGATPDGFDFQLIALTPSIVLCTHLVCRLMQGCAAQFAWLYASLDVSMISRLISRVLPTIVVLALLLALFCILSPIGFSLNEIAYLVGHTGFWLVVIVAQSFSKTGEQDPKKEALYFIACIINMAALSALGTETVLWELGFALVFLVSLPQRVEASLAASTNNA